MTILVPKQRQMKKVKYKLTKKGTIEYYHKRKITWLSTASTLLVW